MAADYSNIFATVLDRVHAANEALIQSEFLPTSVDQSRVVVEPPRDPTHGDMATNAAMVLGKDARVMPRALAEAIAHKLRRDDLFAKVDVAGPGFINLTLKASVWAEALKSAISAGANYGRSDLGKGTPVNVEYVSANPTGPMHVGHGRGAVFGDALSSLLAFVGFAVTREYYINDAGAQVDVLARSAFLRYREALGEDIGKIPEGYYPGEYLRPVGQVLVNLFGRGLLEKSDSERLPIVRQVAIESMLIEVLKDLDKLNIRFDNFFSERALSEGAVRFSAPDQRPTFYFAQSSYDLTPGGPGGIRAYLAQQKLKEARAKGANVSTITFTAEKVEGPLGKPGFLDRTLEDLDRHGFIYPGRLPPPKGAPVEDWEDREQTLFHSKDFGDDVDRPLKKSDGSYTYFATDIAYHKSKIDRGFPMMIDVWGADHGGYIKRMKAAVSALNRLSNAPPATLDVKIVEPIDVKVVQLVRVFRAGEPVRMSKRSGDFVALSDVIDEVKSDAVRFMMLYRKNDAVLDFDLAKVIEQSRDNAVFYVQYGHARAHSIFRNARDTVPDLPLDAAARAAWLAQAPLELLTDGSELALMKKIGAWPRLIESAAAAHEPHRIAFYLYELASEFHALWTKGGKDSPHLRFIIQSNPRLTAARLALVQGVATVLASGLALLGVGAPEEMR